MPDREADERGVSLAHYLAEHAGVGVRLICESCQLSRDLPMQSVLDRLKARGVGDASTGIREVARYADQACKRCGAMRWSSRPAFVVK